MAESGGHCQKNSETGIQFYMRFSKWTKNEPYSEFSMSFKNRTLSKLKAEFCVWTSLASRSTLMLL